MEIGLSSGQAQIKSHQLTMHKPLLGFYWPCNIDLKYNSKKSLKSFEVILLCYISLKQWKQISMCKTSHVYITALMLGGQILTKNIQAFRPSLLVYGCWLYSLFCSFSIGLLECISFDSLQLCLCGQISIIKYTPSWLTLLQPFIELFAFFQQILDIVRWLADRWEFGGGENYCIFSVGETVKYGCNKTKQNATLFAETIHLCKITDF